MPPPIIGPNDLQPTPSWFHDAITSILRSTAQTPTKPPFIFQYTHEAAAHNARALAAFDYDLDALIRCHHQSAIGFGSEFRPLSQLRPLLSKHPLFPFWEEYLSSGVPYSFRSDLPEGVRLKELQAMLQRGNHKSAADRMDVVQRLLTKDVEHGFKVPIPTSTVARIPGAMVHPLGVVEQMSMDAKGNRVPKQRLTQDLSFSLTMDQVSVNSRLDMDQYSEMIFGWCLPRLIHYIVALRRDYPGEPILVCKFDYSDAYRRGVHSGAAAAMTISAVGDLACISTRLTFGGAANPPSWCSFSEVATDLANEILQCTEWDHNTEFNPVLPTISAPKRLPSYGHFADAKPTAVRVPTNHAGKVDDFIDDLILVFVDREDNCQRSPKAPLLAGHITSRPHAGDSEPIPRRPIFGPEKLAAEGVPAEEQIVLGWRLNTRSLTIHLTNDKFSAWSSDIRRVLRSKRINADELASLNGRLNHASYIIPLARHFMGRLNSFSPKNRSTPIPDPILADLRLWLTFLHRAHRGISLNLLTIRIPTRISFSDACPFGIGGYLVTSGRAWRLEIPRSSPLFGDSRYNNLWEFVGMAVNAWLECSHSEPTDLDCCLVLGDNTSALGWLHNTTRLYSSEAAKEAHYFVARTLATCVIKANCCLASQHIKGEHNIVADLLSFRGTHRDKYHPIAHDDPPDAELTRRFHCHYSRQIPKAFRILPLPSEILCWFSQVVAIAQSSWTPARKDPMRSRTGYSAGGEDSAQEPGSTPTSHSTRPNNASLPPEPSSRATEPPPGTKTVDLPAIVAKQWLCRLSERPQATWLRRSGTVSCQVPFTNRTAPSSCPPSAPC